MIALVRAKKYWAHIHKMQFLKSDQIFSEVFYKITKKPLKLFIGVQKYIGF